jgi:phage shock protein PspC (stress-responsive transcriptional regulator)
VWTLEQDGEERELEYDPREGGTFRLYEHAPMSDATVYLEPVSEAVGEGGTPPDQIEYDGTQYVITEKDARVHDEGRVREGEADHISFLARSCVDRQFQGACGGLARHLRLPSWLVRLVVFAVVFFSVLGVVFATFGEIASYTDGMILWVLLGIAGMTWGGYRSFAFFVPEAPPKALSHYWVYESDEGGLLTLQRARGRWTMRVGREVAPYEFDNILPPSEN